MFVFPGVAEFVECLHMCVFLFGCLQWGGGWFISIFRFGVHVGSISVGRKELMKST